MGLLKNYPLAPAWATRSAILALLLAVVGAAAWAPRCSAARVPVRVLHVIDGDTVVARLGGRRVKVRLLGVDTPELGRDGRPAEPFAREAKRFASDLIRAAEGVDLEIAGDRVDEHGRILGFLWLRLPGRPEPVNLSEELLRAGLADAIRWFRYPGKQRFLALEAEARARRLGKWGLGARD